MNVNDLIRVLQQINGANDGVGISENIAQIDIQNPYREFTFTIPANDTETVYYAYDYFRVIEYTGSANSLKVRFGSSGGETDFRGAGIGYSLVQPVDRVELRNTSGSDLTLTIALATGQISDDRLNVSGTVSTSENSAVGGGDQITPVTVSTTAIELVAENSSRKTLFIKNPVGNATLYVGNASVTTSNGFPVAGGETFVSDNDGNQYYGIAAAALGNDVRALEVIK